MLTKAYDKVGQEITKGCFIAYGHALGRCAGLRIGRVESVNFSEEEGYDWDSEHNIVEKILETVTVTVLGIDDDCKPIKILEKKSTLFFPERMVVLNSIPKNYIELYENDCVAKGGKHKWIKRGNPKMVFNFHKYCPVCHLNEGSFQ